MLFFVLWGVQESECHRDMEDATTLGANVDIFNQLGVIAKARILLNLH